MRMAWLLWMACGTSTEAVTLSEVYDVPPPPDSRTVAFELSWAPDLGRVLTLTGPPPTTLDADVVDVTPHNGRFTVTAYAPEAASDLAIGMQGWTAPVK